MNLLNDQNPVHIFLNRIGDIIIANIMFILCSLLVFTIGPSVTALYHCMLCAAKGESGGTVKLFMRAFKSNFKQSFIVSLGGCFVAVVLVFNLGFWEGHGNQLGNVMYYFSWGLILLLLFWAMYIFPVIAAFYNTTGKLVKNAILFVFLHFPVTILTAILTILPMYMTYRDLKLLPLYTFCWFFFGFGLIAYINSLFFYRIFKPYLKAGESERGKSIVPDTQ